ncbi:MAG: hypothetical protein M0Z31_04585, partial [Clostridia bacterium]|nr:hypothetical protein [Clostridia bacterium]
MENPAAVTLSKRAKMLLAIHGVFLTGVSLSNIFFNVYLWKVNGNIKLAAAYNFYHFLTVPIVFILGSLLVKNLGSLGNIRLGLIVHSFFYLLVLILGQEVGEWYIFLGILMGIGQGFYYLGYNVSTYDWTDNHNRNIYSGLNGALGAMANLAPLAGGVMIGLLGTFWGYKAVFAITLLCFILAAVISFNIHVVGSEKTAKYSAAVKRIGKDWLRVSGSMILRGLREGVMSFALILLIYEFTSSEINLGLFNLITGLFTMIFYFIVGKTINQNRRYSSMLWGAVLLSVTSIVLLRQDIIGIWLFGIANSILFPFVFVPMTTISYNIIRNNVVTRDYRIEFLSLREVPLNLGRLIGIGQIG